MGDEAEDEDEEHDESKKDAIVSMVAGTIDARDSAVAVLAATGERVCACVAGGPGTDAAFTLERLKPLTAACAALRRVPSVARRDVDGRE